MTLFLADVACWWWSQYCMNFLIGICSITLSGSFVLLGYFPSPHLVWPPCPPRYVFITGGLEDLCQYAPPPTAHFIGVSWLIPAPWGGALHWESSMLSWTAWFRLSWFLQGIFVTLFVVLLLRELLGLSQTFSELFTLDLTVAGISSDSQTWYVDWQYV